eukprot:6420003-Amphidinium_carterae.1
MVDECPVDGNLFSAIANVTCFVRLLSTRLTFQMLAKIAATCSSKLTLAMLSMRSEPKNHEVAEALHHCNSIKASLVGVVHLCQFGLRIRPRRSMNLTAPEQVASNLLSANQTALLTCQDRSESRPHGKVHSTQKIRKTYNRK